MTLTSYEVWHSPLRLSSLPFMVGRKLRCVSINCLFGNLYKDPLLPLCWAEASLTLGNHIGHRQFSLFSHKPLTSKDKLQTLSITLSVYSGLRQQKGGLLVVVVQESSCGAETRHCQSSAMLCLNNISTTLEVGGA